MTVMTQRRRALHRHGVRPAELVQMAMIAKRHYLEGRSKLEIAEEFGLSRHKVARSLLKARESGVVRISIDFPGDLTAAVCRQIASAYRLRRAVVVDTPDSDEAVIEPLGRAGAGLVADVIEEGETLGIAMDRTLSPLTAQLGNLAPCSVVQLTGAFSSASIRENPVELIRRIPSINHGSVYRIDAPLFVAQAETAAELRRRPDVQKALDRHRQVTTAVVGIGSWTPPYSTVHDDIPEVDRDTLTQQGVVAEVCTTMIDTNGQVVSTPLTSRLISIDAQQLHAVPNVVAVAGGPSKRRAIAAALASGLINALVTDSSTAHYLLAAATHTDRQAITFPAGRLKRRPSLPRWSAASYELLE